MPINIPDWKDGDVIDAIRLNQMKNDAATVTATNTFANVQRAPTPGSGDDTDLVNRKFYFDNLPSGGGGGGASLPVGGTTGQALVKNSGGDGDVIWSTITATGVGAYTTTETDTLLSGKAAVGHTHSAATTSADGFMSAGDKSKLDNAASLATATTLVMRDASGRARVADPTNAADIATKGYVDALHPLPTNLGNMSGSVALNVQSRNEVMLRGILTGNVTLSLTNVPSADLVVVTLAVRQDGTGGRTVAFPGGSVYLNGSDGTVDPAAGSLSIITLVRDNSSTNWRVAIADARAPKLAGYYYNIPADGTYYISIEGNQTLELGAVKKAGTATFAFAKSTDKTTFSAASGTTSFADDNVLRVTVTGFSTWATLTIPRSA